jgi:phage terminase small subunit
MDGNQSLVTSNDSSEDKELTVKQARWLKAYIQTGNATESAKLAGYDATSEDSFAAIGYQNFRKLQMSELLESMGLTKQSLVKVLAIGITRPTKKILKKTRTYYREPVNENGEEIKWARDNKGKLIVLGTEMITEMEYEDTIDYEERRKNAELALKLHGELKSGSGDQKIQQNFAEGATVQILNYSDKKQEIKVVQTPQKESQTVVGQKSQ